MLGFVGKVVWVAGKIVVRHVVVPIVITAVTAAVLSKMAERMNEQTLARSRSFREDPGQALLAA